ncbi:hypothetical protein T440DRAFT_509303 [Plenodomus tracheiphilus IPT5]|uniref:Ecp2 effector protein domain-containing protein n=1 Tax=Plenodomus tracheiphilus IPT5 TaxID=1408161 RepID=A0A6A7B0Q5_9PLEO|nr:hypothetical protein T440DRAFT_509303 [Plenodomus tracheiphilus IPT5]
MKYTPLFTSLLSLLMLPYTHASPIYPQDLTLPPSTNQTSLYPRGGTGSAPLIGTCPHRHLPTEDSYYTALHAFCRTTIPTSGIKITPGKPLVNTIFLTAYDDKPISWVFRVSVEKNMGFAHLTQDRCFYHFESMLTSDYAGGLGKAYCVMGGTGGDKVGKVGMSGEGVVGVMAGKVKDPERDETGNTYTWEMRHVG